MYARFDAYLEQHPILDSVYGYGCILIKSFVFVFLLTNFLFKPIYVQGSSMFPTIQNGSIGVSSILHKNVAGIKRFDIIMFHEADEVLMKRVIGLPNDTIEISNDVLYINQEKVEETYLNTTYRDEVLQRSTYFTKDFGPITLSNTQYFVMGDNRQDSYDSRMFGSIEESSIISKDVFLLSK